MTRASAVNIPFLVLGCFETHLKKSSKLRYPIFLGSSIISFQCPWSRVILDLGLMIVQSLWPSAGSGLLGFPFGMIPGMRSLSSLSFLCRRRILFCLGSSRDPFVGAACSMLLGITGGRGVSFPVAIVTEAEGCGAVTSGFVEEF